MADRFVSVATVSGRFNAEILKSYLEAYGIQCELSGESAGWVQGFTYGPLAEVDILVPSRQGAEASRLVKLFEISKS